MIFYFAINEFTFFLALSYKKVYVFTNVLVFKRRVITKDCKMKKKFFLSMMSIMLILTNVTYCVSNAYDNDTRTTVEPPLSTAGSTPAQSSSDTVGMAMIGAGTLGIVAILMLVAFAPHSAAVHSHTIENPN